MTNYFLDAAASGWVEQKSCFLYRMCLQRLPAMVREWWSETDHHVKGIVARCTSANVSPLLIASELKAVQNEALAELDKVKVLSLSSICFDQRAVHYNDEEDHRT